MHRTTTTATLLVTVALSALTGCVTVQRPAAPGLPTGPSQPSAPRPDGAAEPRIVQAPAHEALQRVGPSRRPRPASPPPPTAAPSAAARTPRQQPQPRTHPVRPARPEPRRPEADRPRVPRAEIPDTTVTIPRNQADVCALGRKYGGWRADSPEAAICGQTYGR